MRVRCLTIDYPPARFIGSEMGTHALLRALSDAGHSVTVHTTNQHDGRSWRHEGIEVVPGRKGFALSHGDADLVVAHVELHGALSHVRAPRVGITHNARPEAVGAAATAVWSMLVHNAEATAAACRPTQQAPDIVVHPPVDWRRWWQQRPHADAVTMVNLTPEKGSDVFYAIAAAMPDQRFIGVVGGWGEPDIRQAPNVEIVDHGADMREVYARTRVLLMPSEHESWGRVAVEAMSTGTPVVATDLPGTRECIGAGGIMVERDWVDGFVTALRSLDEPWRYNAISSAAFARAVELDPAPQLARWVECCEALASGTAGPWNADDVEMWRHTSGMAKTMRIDDPHRARFVANPAWEAVR